MTHCRRQRTPKGNEVSEWSDEWTFLWMNLLPLCSLSLSFTLCLSRVDDDDAMAIVFFPLFLLHSSLNCHLFLNAFHESHDKNIVFRTISFLCAFICHEASYFKLIEKCLENENWFDRRICQILKEHSVFPRLYIQHSFYRYWYYRHISCQKSAPFFGNFHRKDAYFLTILDYWSLPYLYGTLCI